MSMLVEGGRWKVEGGIIRSIAFVSRHEGIRPVMKVFGYVDFSCWPGNGLDAPATERKNSLQTSGWIT